MANYPSLKIEAPMDESWVDDTMVSRAISGAPKARRLFETKKRQFKLLHKDISAADVLTLETFYDTNRNLVLVFQHPITLINYDVIFGDTSGIRVTISSSLLHDVHVTLLET